MPALPRQHKKRWLHKIDVFAGGPRPKSRGGLLFKSRKMKRGQELYLHRQVGDEERAIIYYVGPHPQKDFLFLFAEEWPAQRLWAGNTKLIGRKYLPDASQVEYLRPKKKQLPARQVAVSPAGQVQMTFRATLSSLFDSRELEALPQLAQAAAARYRNYARRADDVERAAYIWKVHRNEIEAEELEALAAVLKTDCYIDEFRSEENANRLLGEINRRLSRAKGERHTFYTCLAGKIQDLVF